MEILLCFELKKRFLGTTQIHLASRNQGKTIENGFQACEITFWRRFPNNSDFSHLHPVGIVIFSQVINCFADQI
jgi:hypothetical protein